MTDDDVPLQEFIEQRFAGHDRLHEEMAESVKLALGVVAKQNERFLDAISSLETFRAKAVGVGAVLVLISGLAGAAIIKALGG